MSHYAGTALWLLVTLTAAVGSYTVNLKVAGARSEVADLRERLVADTRAIRNLEAELRTRARLPEMQRWNDEVLKMSAPAAGQFLASPVVLAGFVEGPDADAGVAGAEAGVRYAVTRPEAAAAAGGVTQTGFEAPVRAAGDTPSAVAGQAPREERREREAVRPVPAVPTPKLITVAAAAPGSDWTPNRPTALPVKAPLDLLPAGAR